MSAVRASIVRGPMIVRSGLPSNGISNSSGPLPPSFPPLRHLRGLADTAPSLVRQPWNRAAAEPAGSCQLQCLQSITNGISTWQDVHKHALHFLDSHCLASPRACVAFRVPLQHSQHRHVGSMAACWAHMHLKKLDLLDDSSVIFDLQLSLCGRPLLMF